MRKCYTLTQCKLLCKSGRFCVQWIPTELAQIDMAVRIQTSGEMFTVKERYAEWLVDKVIANQHIFGNLKEFVAAHRPPEKPWCPEENTA